MGPEEATVGRRLAAIFAADVAGYSRLMGQDEEGTLRALSAARATLSGLIAEHGGRVVNTVGDSALAEFLSVVDAVQCAIAVQRKLAGDPALTTEGSRLQFRIAVHVGDVMSSGTDIFGDGINVCARLQELAEPGGICVSGAAYQYVRKALKVTFDDLGERTLKNIDEPVRVFAIRTKDGAGSSPPKQVASGQIPRPQMKPRTLAFVLAGGLAAVMAIFLLYQFTTQPGTTAGQKTGIEVAKRAASSPSGAIAIAVLPFENLSGDAGQEFFSDGITEEITTALSKVPDLRVVARTSAYQFRAQNRDIQSIGQKLHATHFIEGSVRKAGDRVRITVQLIKADDGTHVWAENYDREFADIFAIQEEIARTIAVSLRMPLGLKPGENLVNNRSIDSQSYEQFLRAGALWQKRGLANATQASLLLEQVVARNPDYAPAWAYLSAVYFLILVTRSANDNGSLAELRLALGELPSKTEAAAQRAIKLDPNYTGGYTTFGVMVRSRAKPLQAEDAFLKALALDPIGPALFAYSNSLASVGKLKQALAMAEKARDLDPFLPALTLDVATELWLNGQTDAAIETAKTLPPEFRADRLAMIYASAGRYSEAAAELDAVASGNGNADAAQAARLLRMAPAKAASPADLPRLPQRFDFVFLYVGAPERILDNYERRADVDFLPGFPMAYFWHPAYAAVRKTERFKAFERKAGMVDYWRARGWPEWCHPTSGDDFECH